MRRSLTLLAFMLTLMSWAAVPSMAAKRVALVVGNGAYEQTGALKNPVNDATDMARKLEALNFDVVSGIDLKEKAFTDTVSRFFDKLKGADVALFFYAGHGLQHQNTNYLVPVDARLGNLLQLKSETISLKDIVAEMEAQAPINLVFLDACRNNPLAEALQRSLKVRGRSLTIARGLAPIKSSSKDTLIAFAAAPGAVASDGTDRNSPFTAALLKHIDTPNMEVEVMLKRVTADVRSSTDSRQEPERLSKLTREFYFKPAAPAAGKPVAAKPPAPKAGSDNATEIAYWNSVKDSRDLAELRSYKARYPGGAFVSLADQRIAALEEASPRATAKPVAPQRPAQPKPAKSPPAADGEITVEETYKAALTYYYGRGVPLDRTKAIRLFRHAAVRGHAKAMYAMGVIYREGVGVTTNRSEAISWFRKAATAGISAANADLAALMRKRAGPQAVVGAPDKQDLAPVRRESPFVDPESSARVRQDFQTPGLERRDVRRDFDARDDRFGRRDFQTPDLERRNAGRQDGRRDDGFGRQENFSGGGRFNGRGGGGEFGR